MSVFVWGQTRTVIVNGFVAAMLEFGRKQVTVGAGVVLYRVDHFPMRTLICWLGSTASGSSPLSESCLRGGHSCSLCPPPPRVVVELRARCCCAFPH